jgi:hypothetical protein
MASAPTSAPELIRIPNAPLPAVRQPESYDSIRGTQTPLIIDNGSTYLRYGFATSSSPVSVPNVIAKFKDRKQNRPLLLMGGAVDIESGAKSQARYPWEGDVLLNFDALVSDGLVWRFNMSWLLGRTKGVVPDASGLYRAHLHEMNIG